MAFPKGCSLLDSAEAVSVSKKLIQMVKDAENRKAPMQRLADKAASWLVPLAMLTAAIAGIITHDIVRSVTKRLCLRGFYLQGEILLSLWTDRQKFLPIG